MARHSEWVVARKREKMKEQDLICVQVCAVANSMFKSIRIKAWRSLVAEGWGSAGGDSQLRLHQFA